MNEGWWVYILECGDGSYYIGVARDVAQRVAKHNLGKGAKYTRRHLPVKVIFTEKMESHSAALKREIELKKLTRTAKQKVIETA